MQKKTVLFINGIPDSRMVELIKIEKDGSTVIQQSGSANIFQYVTTQRFYKSILTFDTNVKQEAQGLRFDALFNQISDPDTHQTTLLKTEKMYRSLPMGVPMFNLPEHIRRTSRDIVCDILKDIRGLHVPKTVRIKPRSPDDIYDAIAKNGFSFPVIFRKAGDHGGVSTIRIDDENEHFYAFALDGSDCYLTQYVDYANKGIYRKLRLVVVDGDVHLRHAIYSNRWMIHSESREFMCKHTKYQTMEKKLIQSFKRDIKPHIQPVITEIHKRLELDYFGIDCHIDEHFSLLAFEINANMNVLTNTASDKKNIWNKPIEQIIEAIEKMVEKRLYS